MHPLLDCPPPRDYVAEVRADINHAIESIKAAPILWLAQPRLDDEGIIDLRGCPRCGGLGGATGADESHGYDPSVSCHYGPYEVPELPEAACRLGVTYLATPRPGPDGRRKVVLQCASAKHLAAWPTWAAANGIVDCYGGDPARGFVEGYLH